VGPEEMDAVRQVHTVCCVLLKWAVLKETPLLMSVSQLCPLICTMGDLIVLYQPGMVFKVACCPTVVLFNLRKYPRLSKVTIFPFLWCNHFEAV